MDQDRGRHPGHVLPSRAVYELEAADAASSGSSRLLRHHAPRLFVPDSGTRHHNPKCPSIATGELRSTFIDSVLDEAASDLLDSLRIQIGRARPSGRCPVRIRRRVSLDGRVSPSAAPRRSSPQ